MAQGAAARDRIGLPDGHPAHLTRPCQARLQRALNQLGASTRPDDPCPVSQARLVETRARRGNPRIFWGSRAHLGDPRARPGDPQESRVKSRVRQGGGSVPLMPPPGPAGGATGVMTCGHAHWILPGVRFGNACVAVP